LGAGAWDATGRLSLVGPAPKVEAMRGSVAKRPRDRLQEMAAQHECLQIFVDFIGTSTRSLVR